MTDGDNRKDMGDQRDNMDENKVDPAIRRTFKNGRGLQRLRRRPAQLACRLKNLRARENGTKESISAIAWHRPGQPEEIALLALFLASLDYGDQVTGETWTIEGGLSMQRGGASDWYELAPLPS